MKLNISFEVEDNYIDNEELNQVNFIIEYLNNNIPSVKLDEVLEELEDIKRAIVTTEMQNLLKVSINDKLAKEYFLDLADQYDFYNHYGMYNNITTAETKQKDGEHHEINL